MQRSAGWLYCCCVPELAAARFFAPAQEGLFALPSLARKRAPQLFLLIYFLMLTFLHPSNPPFCGNRQTAA
jgi:hypothetical protein